MNIYLDTSVLVAVYALEQKTKKIRTLLQETEAKIYISRLAEVEFYSALALKTRTKELPLELIKQIASLFDRQLQDAIFTKVFITDEVFSIGIEFLNKFNTNLRTLDALHLACCQHLGAKLITADKELSHAAYQLKIPVTLL